MCVCNLIFFLFFFFALKDIIGTTGIRPVGGKMFCYKGHYWDNMVCGLDNSNGGKVNFLMRTLCCGC